MRKLTKAEFDELTVKLHNYLKNVKQCTLADALGVKDAEAYHNYMIAEAYNQHPDRFQKLLALRGEA